MNGICPFKVEKLFLVSQVAADRLTCTGTVVKTVNIGNHDTPNSRISLTIVRMKGRREHTVNLKEGDVCSKTVDEQMKDVCRQADHPGQLKPKRGDSTHKHVFAILP